MTQTLAAGGSGEGTEPLAPEPLAPEPLAPEPLAPGSLAPEHPHASHDHPPPAGFAYAQAAGGYPYPQYVTPPMGRFATVVSRFVTRMPGWAAPVAVAVCFAGGAAGVLALNPTDSDASSVPTCIVKMTTGFDCPGCGGTRAFFYLLHGNLPAAARHHVLAVFAAPFVVWLYVAWFAQSAFGRTIPAPRITTRTIAFFLAVWMVFTVARNLPWPPFTWLYV